MGDTPSNYNEANLRFHSMNAKENNLDKLEEQNEEESNQEARLPRKKKKGRKKKKDPPVQFREPNEREKLMADAYGGEAKPVPIKAN